MSLILESIFQDLYALGIDNFAREVFLLKKQGFKVYIQCPSESIARFVFNNFRHLSARYGVTEEMIFSSYTEINAFKINVLSNPCVLVTHLPIESAWGFVRFPLPDLNLMLPATPKLISHVLQKLMLDRYIDCFDAHVTQLVKRIAELHGLEKSIDAIVQVALLAGFKGDESEACLYLETLLLKPVAETDPKTGAESTPQSPEDFFGQLLLRTNEPHTLLKVALSFYAVRLRGQSISRASRHLNISRTTLIQHLRLAEKLNVKTLFPSLTKSHLSMHSQNAKRTNRLQLSK